MSPESRNPADRISRACNLFSLLTRLHMICHILMCMRLGILLARKSFRSIARSLFVLTARSNAELLPPVPQRIAVTDNVRYLFFRASVPSSAHTHCAAVAPSTAPLSTVHDPIEATDDLFYVYLHPFPQNTVHTLAE